MPVGSRRVVGGVTTGTAVRSYGYRTFDQESSMTDREQLLDELRPVAFSIAYRMLGSVSEAEDVVQEALLRVHQTLDAGEHLASPQAFVATVTTRLAINELRSARARRERYVGEWLPEPIVTDRDNDPARYTETADSLS